MIRFHWLVPQVVDRRKVLTLYFVKFRIKDRCTSRHSPLVAEQLGHRDRKLIILLGQLSIVIRISLGKSGYSHYFLRKEESKQDSIIRISYQK